MKYAVPEHTREEVNQAGRLLLNQSSISADQKVAAVRVISNWRASHSYPLNALRMTLQNRAKRIDPDALVSQRLKRLASVEAKLRKSPWMHLTQMQDIGGCRAVVSDVHAVERLVQAYMRSGAKNPGRLGAAKVNDYIAAPKSDGYRSVHLVYRYARSAAPSSIAYDGLKIEIQIRTRLQHAWATTLETVDAFTGQQLKTGGGNSDWKRFFALAGTLLAFREGTPPVPETPSDAIAVLTEFFALQKRLAVLSKLSTWQHAIQNLPGSGPSDSSVYLLHLDLRDGAPKLQIRGFVKADIEAANEEYAKLEQSIRDTSEGHAVLVSVDSLEHLAEAYPNYYADTSLFMSEVLEGAQIALDRLAKANEIEQQVILSETEAAFRWIVSQWRDKQNTVHVWVSYRDLRTRQFSCVVQEISDDDIVLVTDDGWLRIFPFGNATIGFAPPETAPPAIRAVDSVVRLDWSNGDVWVLNENLAPQTDAPPAIDV